MGINPALGCGRTKDPDMALHCSPDFDVTMALGGSRGHPYYHGLGGSVALGH